MRSGRVQNRNSFCRDRLFFEVLASLRRAKEDSRPLPRSVVRRRRRGTAIQAAADRRWIDSGVLTFASGTTPVTAPQDPHLYEDASGNSIAQTTEQFPAAFVLLFQGQSRWLTTTSLLSGGRIQSPAHQRTRQLRVSRLSEKALASSHRERTEP